MIRPDVLIQTVGRDTPALMIAAAVSELGGQPLVHAQTGIIGHPEFSIHLDADGCGVTSTDNDLSGVRSVWNRRFPATIDMPADAHPADTSFLDQNARLFLKAFTAAFDRALQVNPLAGKLVTADKMSQLRAAARSGLKIPETLVTADASEVRAFAARHGPICTKPFSSGVWRSPDHEELLFSITGTLTEEHLRDDDAIAMVPHIYQPYVDKAYEVRMTVFGRYCAALKILSQNSPGTAEDWRIDFAYLKALEPTVPPTEILERCFAALEALKLRFGVFDFIVTPKGEWVFLEINEAGQFLWQEQHCDQSRVIEPFARFLIEGRPDFTWDPASRNLGIEPRAMYDAVVATPRLNAVLLEATENFSEGIGHE